jgi:hypothetical protein
VVIFVTILLICFSILLFSKRRKVYLGISSLYTTTTTNIASRIQDYQYSRLGDQNEDSDADEDDLLFGIETVEDHVFPLIPDELVERPHTDDETPLDPLEGVRGDLSIQGGRRADDNDLQMVRVPTDPLGVSFRDDPDDSDEDLLL